MAGNLSRESILADWRFWEQSANISSAKALQCAVIIIRNHSFHVYNRPATGRAGVIVGMEFAIHTCVRGYYVSKWFRTPEGGRRVGLLRQSKRCVRGRCKDRCWCRCRPLTEEDRQPVLCFRVGVVRSSETSFTAQVNSQRFRLAILLWIIFWLRLSQPQK